MKSRLGSFRAVVLTWLLALGPGSSPVAWAAEGSAGLAHFITRREGRLYDGEKEFRFVGANMPGLMLPYDFTMRLPGRMTLPTAWEQEDAFQTLDQMNLRVVRLWNLPIRAPDEEAKPWHYVLGPGQFNEAAFVVLDQVFALANKHGVRVIFNFTADSGDYLGGIGTYAAHRGKPRAAFYTDPQLREDYKATVRHVLGRTNTVTGIKYSDDKAVLAWQFGNEMPPAPDGWLKEMGALIKELAPHQLVSETRHRPNVPSYIDGNIDLVTRHLYTNYPGVEDGWPAALKRAVAAVKGERPLFIGEVGPYIDHKMLTAENVLAKTRELLDYVESEPAISGVLLWSMYFHHERGGYYWHQVFTYPAVWSYHWPGFPSADAQRERGLMQLWRGAAFRIQGKPVPPVPIPGSPELLPIAAVPQLSWRGSVGATGYDLERAASQEGPWQTLAENVSDADVAYRPLFSDESVRAGDTWFYRVVARNETGSSKPSNVVGPVKVTGACLVDELQTLGRAQGHSESLQLDNAYNGIYAEYLFRARGVAEDWISYKVPGPIERVKLTIFFSRAATPAEPIVEFSADGVTFQASRAEGRVVRELPKPPGGPGGGQSRTMIDYELRPPSGQTQLRIRWQGPAELDRVEIYHPGLAL